MHTGHGYTFSKTSFTSYAFTSCFPALLFFTLCVIKSIRIKILINKLLLCAHTLCRTCWMQFQWSMLKSQFKWPFICVDLFPIFHRARVIQKIELKIEFFFDDKCYISHFWSWIWSSRRRKKPRTNKLQCEHNFRWKSIWHQWKIIVVNSHSFFERKKNNHRFGKKE